MPYVECPECDYRFRIRSEEAGRKVRCPSCDEVVRPFPASGDIDAADDKRQPRRRKAPPAKSGRSTLVVLLAIGGVLFGVVALICGGIGFAIWKAQAPTEFPEETENYAQARKGFKTTLQLQGPAPQGWLPEVAPPGVDEVEYQSGNLKLKAWVTSPGANPVRKPAIVFLHGGFAFDHSDWEQTKPFRDAGFVVMTPMLRGENGLPGSYSMFYDEVEDALAAADALAKMPHVDGKRLFIAGHSVGGTLAMLTAMSTDRFKAAASFSGSPDQVAWSRGQEHLVPFDIDDEREFQMRSPLAFPKSFKCPTRIFFGSQEMLFAASSQKTAARAKAANLDVEAISVPGDHMSSVDPAMRQCIPFFQQK